MVSSAGNAARMAKRASYVQWWSSALVPLGGPCTRTAPVTGQKSVINLALPLRIYACASARVRPRLPAHLSIGAVCNGPASSSHQIAQPRLAPTVYARSMRFFSRAAKSAGVSPPQAVRDRMRDHGESADAGSAAGGGSLVPAAALARHGRSREQVRLRRGIEPGRSCSNHAD